MSAPAWQTDDLEEEWVSDGSPTNSPQAVVRSQPSSLRNSRNSASHSSPTKSRSVDLSSFVEHDEDDGESLLQSEDDTNPQGGTFLIRADQPLPETPLGMKPGQMPKKGAIKTFFSPLALERLFEPPSPPRASTTAMPDEPPRSTTPPLPPSPQASPVTRPQPQPHPARARLPSKLSQSHIPASDTEADSLLDDSGVTERSVDGDEIVASDIPGLVKFDGRKASANFKFTFQVPKTPGDATGNAEKSFHISPPNPTPNPRALQNNQCGWLHGQADSDEAPSPVPPGTDPRLKLFQFKYDTFTRDHLGALADSIAIRADEEDVEDDRSDEPVWRSNKRLRLTPPEDLSSRTSSSRDFRNSPWGKVQSRQYLRTSRSIARGNQLPSLLADVHASFVLDARPGAILQTDPDVPTDVDQRRITSASSTETASTAATAITPVESIEVPLVAIKRSTVNYRLQGVNILAKIKSDVDLSLDDVDGEPREPASSQSTSDILSQSKGQMGMEGLHASSTGILPKQKSPRKLLRRLSAADEVDRDLLEEIGGLDKSIRDLRAKNLPHLTSSQIAVPPTVVFAVASSAVTTATAVTVVPPTPGMTEPKALPMIPGRRIPSTAPLTLHPNHQPAHEDMNRFVSSSTAASGISGTTAGSFVKHPGSGPGQLITIGPERMKDVVLPSTGGMVYSEREHKWVRIAKGVEDSSEDPFAEIESLLGTPRSAEHHVVQTAPEESSAGGSSMTQADESEEQQSKDSLLDDDDENENEQEREPEDHTGNESEQPVFVDASPAPSPVRNGQIVNLNQSVVIQYDSDVTSTMDFTKASEPPAPEEVLPLVAQTPRTHARSLEELAAGIADMSLQMDLSPPRPARPSTVNLSAPVNRTPAPASTSSIFGTPGPIARLTATPKSVLKPTPGLATPYPARAGPNTASQRRSVSFSDGLRNGKIRDEEGSDLGVSTETDESDRSGVMEGSSAGPATEIIPTSLASSRTKRIGALLDGFNDTGGFSTFVTQKEPSRLARTQGTLTEDGPVPASPSTDAYAAASSASRSFARTRKKLPGDATFLTTDPSFRVTHDQLIRVLTSIEPYEPYWEQLKSVDLSKRGLESLNRLDELLPALDRLRADHNQLTWLTGVPSNLRVLLSVNNALTSLTSYAHLPNIEELDISYNQVDSLKQLECLHQLRELKADGNQLTNLEGLSQLDKLVKVSVKANKINKADLRGFSWPRVETLDLSSNCLGSVEGLGALPALVSVNLDHNELGSFSSDVSLAKLRVLRLSGNRLTRLDMTGFPSLRTLYADNNRIAELVGINRLTRLENLSLRSQAGGKLSLSLRDVRDVKRLYLSGNPLNDSNLFNEACYNLVYLELAACRLTVLPANMAQMTPNLRALNLNYNFLSDIAKPLTGLTRLRKLTVVGSRLKGSKPVLKMLHKMPEMELVDMRMNPFSLGWYLPLMVSDISGALQPSERGQAVVPTSPGQKRSSNGEARPSSSLPWTELDNRFRRDLPDEVYVARMGFRGLVMRACPRMVNLDGVPVTDAEREKTGKLLKGLERSVNGRSKA